MKGKVREGEIANENFIGKYAISVELKREECEFISNRTEISEDKTGYHIRLEDLLPLELFLCRLDNYLAEML